MSITEWIEKGENPSEEQWKKIEQWVDIFSGIRSQVDFGIQITDGIRLSAYGSQHEFRSDSEGATDCRPVLIDDKKQYSKNLISLGMLLAINKDITRVCLYPKGDLFPNGGYHVDRVSVPEKQYFISNPDVSEWDNITFKFFIELCIHNYHE